MRHYPSPLPDHIFDRYETQFNMMKNIASKRYIEIKKLRQEVADLKEEKRILNNLVTDFLMEDINKNSPDNKMFKSYEII